MIVMKHMNMNWFVLVRVEIENETKILKNLGHNIDDILLQTYYFFSIDKISAILFNVQVFFWII